MADGKEISRKIQGIIDRRKKHLPMIESKRKHLQDVLESLNKLDMLVNTTQEKLDKNEEPYFSIQKENPEFGMRVSKINTSEIREKVEKQLKRLEILEKRFSRESVSIAMIGYERQGKSQFLQTISGLDSKVIPAYDGMSCTGAVSVIRNLDGPFRAEVDFYNEQEFLNIINETLDHIYNGKVSHISSVEGFGRLDFDSLDNGYKTNDVNKNREREKLRAWKNSYADWCNFIGKGKETFTDENVVKEFVAQYDGDKPEIRFNKYVAVKGVTLYKKFDLTDCREIELIDTIGMGDSSNASKIEEEMFRVLKEECDAAVDLFKPNGNGDSFNTAQTNVLNKISEELKDREPSKWIYYVINNITEGNGKNSHIVNEIKEQAIRGIKDMDIKPVADVKVVDGKNPEEVKEKIIIPLLSMVSDNLEYLDGCLMEKAKKCGQFIYDEYFVLSESVKKVITKSSTDTGKFLDDHFEPLYNDFLEALRRIDVGDNNDGGYKAKRNEPNMKIKEALKKVNEGIYNHVPELMEYAEYKLRVGGLDGSPSHVFDDCCEILINKVVDDFKSVSEDVISPMVEDVKNELSNVIFKVAKLGEIRLKGSSKRKGDVLWLKELNKEYVKDKLPFVEDAFNYIIEYFFSIKDAVDYYVRQSLEKIDQNDLKTFEQYKGKEIKLNEQKENIYYELCNRIPDIQQGIRISVLDGDYCKMPNNSFWARVNNFRNKVRQPNFKKDFKELYRERMADIWADEIGSLEDKKTVVGEWNGMSKKIDKLCNQESFNL